MVSSRSPLSRLASGAALAVLVTLLAVPLAAAPAYADPPVTVDDTLEAYAGSFTQVDVLSNDSDPDGPEDLTVCRVKGGTNKVKPIL